MSLLSVTYSFFMITFIFEVCNQGVNERGENCTYNYYGVSWVIRLKAPKDILSKRTVLLIFRQVGFLTETNNIEGAVMSAHSTNSIKTK